MQMILLIIHRYLFWWISTSMESTYLAERWWTPLLGILNIPNPSEVQYTSIFYLFTGVIIVQKKIDALPNCPNNPLTALTITFLLIPLLFQRNHRVIRCFSTHLAIYWSSIIIRQQHVCPTFHLITTLSFEFSPNKSPHIPPSQCL